MSKNSQSHQGLPELKPTAAGDALYRVLGNAARLIYHGLMTLTVEGAEKLPRGEGYIMVANHTTEIDAITVAYPAFTTGTLPRFLAKESLFHAPILGGILRSLAHIPVSRGSVDARKSLETAQNVISSGGAVIIYPEGTLCKDPQGWPMVGKTGAARLALATGAPVYPIAHWGDQEFLPPKGKPKFFPRKHVKVLVGDRLDFSDVASAEKEKYSRKDLNLLTERMLDQITELLEEIRQEKAPAGRYNPATGQREVKG